MTPAKLARLSLVALLSAPPALAQEAAPAKPAPTVKTAPPAKVKSAPAQQKSGGEKNAPAEQKPADKSAPAAASSNDNIKKAAEAAARAAARLNPNASDPEAEKIWRAYEQRWAETEDYAAGFRQIIEVADVGTKVESAGRFFFAKPDLVRWEYTEGPPQTVVGDGQTIWLYQPDLEQVYKIPYSKAFGRGGLVALLAGRKGVAERYVATLKRPDPATVLIHLKPREQGHEDLEVKLDAQTFDLQAVTVRDAAGSVTQMTFAEPQRNRGSDKAHFLFTPPSGVDVITDPQPGF
ncbi:MAG TPA: outer-membrane lipoprotein carrier protein LolA [Candidatus Limnocylindrales bacterium]|nr:outer-membrane lipoprotein carrier protein LolA [Candidatus Limnocylindrales bacterium]